MLSDSDVAAVRAYCHRDFEPINAYLRGEEAGDARIATLVRRLDAAFAHAEVAGAGTLYRGLDGDAVSFLRGRGLAVGSILTELAYMSTSDRLLNARTFAAWPPGGLVMHLRPAATTRVLEVSPFSPFPDETELLLPRGTSILVTSLHYDRGWLEAEIL